MSAMRATGLALVLVVGHVVDRTTGQPLVGVDVNVQGPAKVAPARTNDAGAYSLRAVTPGRYSIELDSADVPPQTFSLTVRAGRTQRFDITACSTTLDFSCAPVVP